MDRVSVDDAPSAEAADNVFLSLLAGGEEMNVQHFRIEPGATVPVHDHPHEQVGYIVAGELTFLVGDDREELVVGPGDSYSLAGGEPHGAENRGDETVVGIDVFSPPRANPPWLD
ncbi:MULTISPECIES: cupin domain-containing protein [unclassified Haloferax]|uniref:cupin domain-containing protein n=1 Tax=unclassified Haloferax TaxID=2625095 RepID=UPI0002AFA742|nr:MULTISPECIES: cupin domain-containing protein [unclassified Haloferax]ELZ55283.1 cupin [Haloferax sp. ATCC BAA-646]ELZ66540.1 cupin [Haloferax sp. ATCC BAA-645]ELZ66729.1 cupin [Haloferax sp. ATCC BAA-644]